MWSLSGSQCSLDVESSEPEQPSTEPESESFDKNEEIVVDLDNGNEEKFTSFIDVSCNKNFVPKYDDQHKPHTNKYFPTLKDAYRFYLEYGRICEFDVRNSTRDLSMEDCS